MTVYVFDTGLFITFFSYYYPNIFPSLWERFNGMVSKGCITSTREVFNELGRHGDSNMDWCREHRQLFPTPTVSEGAFVSEIFKVSRFKEMATKKNVIDGRPIADPFVIARAKHLSDRGISSCVVTTEKRTPNASKIPNVCEHFGIDCVNPEGFMERENWRF